MPSHEHRFIKWQENIVQVSFYIQYTDYVSRNSKATHIDAVGKWQNNGREEGNNGNYNQKVFRTAQPIVMLPLGIWSIPLSGPY
jgi:hypothetical protein